MTDEMETANAIQQRREPTKDNSNREMAIRTQALDMALRSNCGQSYDKEGRPIHDHNKTIEGAKAFESFIRGEVSAKPETIKKDE